MLSIRALPASPRMLAAALLLMYAARASAQCPDGSPPPCRSAKATAARPAPAKLNPRAWIVVPFSNVTRAPDIDWLRDASVNLLSMDMGRWTDVSVVPDKRVADLVRELPPAKRNQSLALSDGIAIAKRAGAGMLVMGDIVKLGAGTRIVATVFDVRSGDKVRTFTRDCPTPDSVLTAFGPVARGVLAVPPPPDAKAGDVGTTSLEAYQEYLLGTKAVYRSDYDGARPHLLRAIALDTAFALAHYQYSIILAAGEAEEGTNESRRQALLARQFATALPARARALIDAQVAYRDVDYTRMCDIARPLVAQDSTDVEALMMFGTCSQLDRSVEPSPSDSATGRFHSSWNTALHAFNRVLELDPGHFDAFEPILTMLTRPIRGGETCPRLGAKSEECDHWEAAVRRVADTLVTVASRFGYKNNAGFYAQRDQAQREGSRRANLDIAQQIAQRWLDADRASEGARYALTQTSLMRGDMPTAAATAKSLPLRATAPNFEILRTVMQVEAMQGHGAKARALFDSLVKAIPDNPAVEATRGSLELMFGRMKRFDHGGQNVATRFGPDAVAYQKQVSLALLGLPQPGLARAESVFYASMNGATCNISCRFARLAPTLAYVPHNSTIPLATLDSAAVQDGRLAAAPAIVKRDTAALRQAAISNETSARVAVSNLEPEFGWSLIAAADYVTLGDTTRALLTIRFYVDSAMALMPINGGISGIVSMGPTALWVRGMVMRADLARAKGFKAEARTWYLRVLDLWGDADAELQPEIDRIKRALAALDVKA